MANTKTCGPCGRGDPANCRGRWQSPSARIKKTGTAPKRVYYSYKCPMRRL